MDTSRYVIVLFVIIAIIIPCIFIVPALLQWPHLSERNVARWLDTELVRLTTELAEHHREHGCYPAEFDRRFDCPGFPLPNARAWTQYVELDLDNYLLGVIVSHSPKQISFDHKVRLGFLTTAAGRPEKVSHFAGPHIDYFRKGHEPFRHELWRIWKGEERAFGPTSAGMEESHQALDDPDPQVRAEAAVALVHFNDRRAIERLVRALRDEHVEVRRRAAWALGRLGDTWAARFLEEAAASDPDAGVRRRAAWAVAQIRSRPERKRGRSSGKSGVTHDFEKGSVGARPQGWHELFGEPAGGITEETSSEGRRSYRLQAPGPAPRCAYFRAGPRARFVFHAALRVDAAAGGAVHVGYVERYGAECEFYNAFRIDLRTGTIEFRATPTTRPVALGTFPRGEWFTLQAQLEFDAGTAKLLVNGEERATTAAIAPWRFESTRRGRVRLSRWGIAAPPSPAVAFADEVWVHSSGRTLD